MKGPLPGSAYLAAAADDTWLEGLSGEQFALLRREPVQGESSWWLMDRHRQSALQLKVPMTRLDTGADIDEPDAYGLARDAPFLVGSSSSSAVLLVVPIQGGPLEPRLVYEGSVLHFARLAGATQGVHLDASGSSLRYQNRRFGTGAGVGQGRTVVMDADDGREIWARGEGEVAWGEPLVALQEFWAETQLLAADTGATWFTAAGRPLGFDPTGRMLLMWDVDNHGVSGAKAQRWPRVWLLEALPVRKFAHDPQGPASNRSACLQSSQLHFLTLAERHDRLWNRDDWHQRAEPSITSGASAATLPNALAQTRVQRVQLEARGKHWWLHPEGESKGSMLDDMQVRRQFPLLTADLHPGQDLHALLTTSADGRWNAVVTAPPENGAACKGWAHWRMHRGQHTTPVKAGCTTGDLPGADELPAVWFLRAQGGAPQMAAVPVDTCRYELLDPERGEVRGSVVPAFGNSVRIERLSPDLLAVHSTD